MRARTVMAGAALASAFSACSLTSLEGLSGGPFSDGGGLTEAGPALDAAAGADSADRAVDAHDAADEGSDASAPNLVPNGDFESGCMGWATYRGTLAGDPRGRTGRGCLVCYASDNVGFAIDSNDTGPANPDLGATFRAEIWVRAASGSADDVRLNVRTQTDDPFRQVQLSATPPVRLTDAWQKLTTELTVLQPAAYLSMFVYADSFKPGTCFLVDDARLVRTE